MANLHRHELSLLSFSGLYYGVSICLVSFASGLAVVTLNLHHRGVQGTRVPGIVRSLVLDKLARIVFLNFQEEKRSVRFIFISENTHSWNENENPFINKLSQCKKIQFDQM